MAKEKYLLDVNVLVALLTEDHLHHRVATDWFVKPKLWWALCAFTEAGFLRIATATATGNLSTDEAASLLFRIKKEPGYHYVSLNDDWQVLSGPIAKRVYGSKQITDAFLLGLAIRNQITLVTFDKGMLHLAGVEHAGSVLLLTV